VELLVPERRNAVDFSSVGRERQNSSCVFVAVLCEDQQKTRGGERKGGGEMGQISWNYDLITHIRKSSIHSILTPTVPQRRRQNNTTPDTYCVSNM
jgi:hypothetical protein